MTKDLTKGSPFKLILFFMLPVLLGNVFQQLYNMADSIIVGRAVSSDAMAGVSSTGSVTFLVLGFASGLTSGFAVRTSQRFGARDEKGVKKSVAASLELCLVLTVLLTAVSMPLTKPLLKLMQTPDKYFDYAYWYLFVCFGGIGATVLYNLAAATLRAIGDTRTPLVILFVSAGLNVGLNLLFILAFGMNYTGVAAATVISQLVAGGGGLGYMLKKYPLLRPAREDWRLGLKLWGGHISIGLPMALQFSITAVGCIIQQSALNSLDDGMPGVVTAYAAATKINNLLGSMFEALGVTMATYAGQNCGAGEYGRIKDGVFAGCAYTFLFWGIGIAVCALFGGPLTSVFLDKTAGDAALYYEEMLRYSEKYLLFQSVFYGALGLIHIYRNALQGIGKSALTMVAGVTELAGRALSSFLLVRYFGFTGICLSNPTAWLAADLFLVSCYYIIMRKNRCARSYGFGRLREMRGKKKKAA